MRSRTTEKTGRRKGILATEGHGISLNKTEAETRKRARKDIKLDTEKTGRRKDRRLATEGHGISRKKTEAEPRKRQAEEKTF